MVRKSEKAAGTATANANATGNANVETEEQGETEEQDNESTDDEDIEEACINKIDDEFQKFNNKMVDFDKEPMREFF